MKKIVCIVLALLMVLSMASCGNKAADPAAPAADGEAEPILLRVSSMNPSNDSKYAVVLQAYFNMVEKETNGLITFELYPSDTAHAAADALSACKTGIVDIAEFYAPFWVGMFPAWELFFMANQYSFPDGNVWANAVCEMMKEYPEFVNEVEAQGVKLLGVHGDAMNQLCLDERIDSVDDLKGKIINAGSNYDKALMESIGAKTEMLNAPDVYDNMSKGVIDGYNFSYIGNIILGTADAIDYICEVNGSHQAWFFIMNEDSYNSIPDQYKYLFEFETMETFIRLWGYQFASDESNAKAILSETKEIYTLSDEEMAKFEAAAEPLLNEWIAKMDELGQDGQAMYDYFRSIVEQGEPDTSTYRDLLLSYGVEVPEHFK